MASISTARALSADARQRYFDAAAACADATRLAAVMREHVPHYAHLIGATLHGLDTAVACAPSECVRTQFWTQLLRHIVARARDLSSLFPGGVPMLTAEGLVVCTRVQAACVLANMFLGVFPQQRSGIVQFSASSFLGMMAANTACNSSEFAQVPGGSTTAKLQLVLVYFGRLLQEHEATVAAASGAVATPSSDAEGAGAGAGAAMPGGGSTSGFTTPRRSVYYRRLGAPRAETSAGAGHAPAAGMVPAAVVGCPALVEPVVVRTPPAPAATARRDAESDAAGEGGTAGGRDRDGRGAPPAAVASDPAAGGVGTVGSVAGAARAAESTPGLPVIEDATGCLQVDFANACIGGGTLGRGAVQEEIRFAECPEAIVAMLICSRMGDCEAVVITGAERFGAHSGYGASLACAGPHHDATLRARDVLPACLLLGEGVPPESAAGLYAGAPLERAAAAGEGVPSLSAGSAVPVDPDTVMVSIAAIDAVPFAWLLHPGAPGDGTGADSWAARLLALQLEEGNLAREATKAFVGFAVDAPECPRAIVPTVATGNWGCGAFGGHVQVKALLQWVAASAAGRAMVYFPFEQAALGHALRAASHALTGALGGGQDAAGDALTGAEAPATLARVVAGGLYAALVAYGRQHARAVEVRTRLLREAARRQQLGGDGDDDPAAAPDTPGADGSAFAGDARAGASPAPVSVFAPEHYAPWLPAAEGWDDWEGHRLLADVVAAAAAGARAAWVAAGTQAGL